MLMVFLSFHVLGSIIVEYRLSYNYGQIFHDFSGNSLSGVNGMTTADTTSDTLPLTVGAYFDGPASQICLPPNDSVTSSFTIPSTFSVIQWVYLIRWHHDFLSIRKHKQSVYFFYIAASSQKLQGSITTSTINSGIMKTGPHVFSLSNI